MTPSERKNLQKLDDLVLNASAEELQKIQDLMQSLDTSKQEGEKSYDFTTRVLDSCRTILQNHTNNNVQKENP